MHLRQSHRVVPTAVLALLLSGSACDDQSNESSVDPNGALSTPSADPDGAAARIVAEKDADLHLWVSNQSFEDATVDISVSIDGVEVIDEPFAVEGQHNWVLFPLAMPPGEHSFTAVSGTGVELERTITLPKTDRRHAVLDYWYYQNKRGRYFELRVMQRPAVFY